MNNGNVMPANGLCPGGAKRLISNLFEPEYWWSAPAD